MNNLPKRKAVRIVDYDYSTPGAYFITVCTANREKIFWSDRLNYLLKKHRENGAFLRADTVAHYGK